MKLLDMLFGKKEEEPEVMPEFENQQVELKKGQVMCDYCCNGIEGHAPRKKISGKVFHRKCFKKIKRHAKKQAFG